jgi:alpha-glucosidase (family GH31 glycosyl hydrolase)
MLLSLGVSGIVFGGCDIPGFYGEPSDDLFVQFYQLGVFYPFMRAHNNIDRTAE